MNNYVVTCSSTCDLTKEYLEEHNNKYVGFYYYIDDVKRVDNFYSDMSESDFYQSLKDHDAKTSQPSPEEYIEVWSKILEEGKDVYHIELSSGISGAYNSSLIAKDMVLEKYPDRKVYVTDSLCASAGYGLLIDIANTIKDNKNIDECYNYIEDIKNKISHVFCTADLTQLLKGGRISKAAFTFGKLLNIVPILHVNMQGKLEALDKIRGLNNALKKMVDIMVENIDKKSEICNKIFIAHSYCKDIVDKFILELKNKTSDLMIPIENIFSIGTVIGAHTGQGTLAVFYLSEKRV